MASGSTFRVTFCYVWMLVWVMGHRTVLAKECTNIPTQDASHTLRAILREKEASTSNISSSYILTPFAKHSAPLWTASLRKEPSADSLDTKHKTSVPTETQLKILKDWHHPGDADFSKVVQKLRHDNPILRGEKRDAQVRKSRSADLFDSFSRRKTSLDHKNATTVVGNKSDTTQSATSAIVQSGSKFEQPLLLKEVSLHRVTLAAHSLHGIAQETNLKYLLLLDVDSLVWNFRVTAGLPATGSPYGGWEHPTMELRGHFVGHYLSAAALMWASTHNNALKEKMETLVNALEECQDQLGTGYLSAFPSEFFDRFEEIRPVWAPYYTIHKIMAGLLDQHVLAGSKKSLGILLWMAEYFLKRVEAVIHKHTIEKHWESLNEEVGGMNDILYRLFMLTEDPDHLKLAHLFDKPCFLGLLALQTDGLSGFHSNTHIPLVVGAQMRFEATGDKLYADMSEYFMDIINTSHRYATGGTSVSEFWTDPNRNGNALGTENQETCTTYNMLKIARNMFRWTKDVQYADYYERTLVNGILGIQRGTEPGVMIYMLPQAPGTSKAISFHGWGTPYNSFWCCYGTGTESFSKLGDSIYFEDTVNPFTLNVAQYVSSNLTWDAVGLLLSQNVLPLSSSDPYLHVTFDFYNLPQGGNGNEAELSLRIPTWAIGTTSHIRLNGLSMGAPTPGNYFNISRAWKAGDVLLVDLHVSLTLEKVQDDRKIYSSLHAILFGPYLLAGMTDGNYDIGAVNTSSLSSWIIPVPDSYSARLFTFSQSSPVLEVSEAQDLGGQVTVLSYGSTSAGMILAPPEGTTDAAECTFVLNTLVGTPSDSLIGSLVSFELYDQPGSLLAHTGMNRMLGVVDKEGPEQSFRMFNRPSNMTSSKTYQPLKAPHSDVTGFQDGFEVFRVLPGLSGVANTISFEAATLQGCFIASDVDGSIQLQCQGEGEQRDPNFNIKASFTAKKGLAKYNPVSFIAKGPTRQFLLFPLYAYLDERYTTYFNLTST